MAFRDRQTVIKYVHVTNKTPNLHIAHIFGVHRAYIHIIFNGIASAREKNKFLLQYRVRFSPLVCIFFMASFGARFFLVRRFCRQKNHVS